MLIGALLGGASGACGAPDDRPPTLEDGAPGAQCLPNAQGNGCFVDGTKEAPVYHVAQCVDGNAVKILEDPLIDTVVRDSGGAGYAEVRLDPRFQVGGELMVTSSDGLARVRGGATGAPLRAPDEPAVAGPGAMGRPAASPAKV